MSNGVKNIILTTTSSFTNAIKGSDLEEFLNANNLAQVLFEDIRPPFPFSADSVLAIVATSSSHRKIGLEIMDFFPKLKLIMPFGTGTDHIDFGAAKKRGIAVAHVPGANRLAVAEMTFGFIFALLRNIISYDTSMKNGSWDRTMGQGVLNKNLGIIGLGNVGREAAKLACGVGMRVFVHDIRYDEEFLHTYPFIKKEDFKKILESSDIITLHVPLTAETHHMIGRREFSLMKPGSFLINTSRGSVVDETALLESLESGHIAGVALDVFSLEPPFESDSLRKLISHPRLIAAPHVASFTPEAQYAVAARIVKNIVAVYNGRMGEIEYAEQA